MDEMRRTEKESGRAAKRKRRKWPFLVIVLLVLAVVGVAAYRNGTGFDALQRYFAYGSGKKESGAVSFSYEISSRNRCALLGDGLAVLSGTGFQVMDGSGEKAWSAAVSMDRPALTTGGGRAAAYDIGGTELYVVDLTGERLHLTADPAEPILSATLNDKGWLAVTAGKKNYKGSVAVYNDQMELVFEFNSSQRFVTEGFVSNSCKTLSAVTLGQSEGTFISSILTYPLDSTEVDTVTDLQDGLVLAVAEKGNHLTALSDTALSVLDGKGGSESYSFDGRYLREYDLGGDGFTAMLLNRYQSGSVGELVTVDDAGKEIASLKVEEQILGLSAAGRYVAVLYGERLVIYNQQLQEYATLNGTESARDVLMRADGSALLLSSGNAKIFLP